METVVKTTWGGLTTLPVAKQQPFCGARACASPLTSVSADLPLIKTCPMCCLPQGSLQSKLKFSSHFPSFTPHYSSALCSLLMGSQLWSIPTYLVIPSAFSERSMWSCWSLERCHKGPDSFHITELSVDHGAIPDTLDISFSKSESTLNRALGSDTTVIRNTSCFLYVF